MPSPIEIFERVVDLPRDERETALDAACAGDTGLLRAVRELLELDADASGFLEPGTAPLLPSPEDVAGHGAPAPGRIGPYRVLERLGEGGFGVVYKAEQAQPIERTVALKVIKPGMDSRAIVRRFEIERATLALMDHPNVARVLDGGLIPNDEPGAGRPWFAMEFVDGVPITDYAREHGLTLEQRVRLIIQACAAAQHAHAKAVIHRDLKPSNILVTTIDGKPVCKIIDFGVAKALSGTLGAARPDVTAHTSPGAMIGTPQYMSPEQARGEAGIDTRTDVYSMGVILYELLAGSPPFDAARLRTPDLHRLREVIEHIEPPVPSSRLADTTGERAGDADARPTAAARRVRGDLDWITMHAMAKEPGRRYETIASLGDDLERFLGNEPVSAGPPSASYKLAKFVRRNRVGVVAGSVAGLAIIAGSVAAVVFGLAAESARADEQAQREGAELGAQRVSDFNDFLIDDLFYAADPAELGPDARIADLLDATAPRAEDRFGDDPEMLLRINSLFASMYHKTHRYEDALPHINRAIEIGENDDSIPLIYRSDAWSMRGAILHLLGRLEEAEADHRRSLELIADAPGISDRARLTREASLGSLLQARAKFDEADEVLTRVIDQYVADTPEHKLYLTKIISNRIASLQGQRRYGEIEPAARRVLELAEDLSGRRASSARLTGSFWLTQSLRAEGREEEAAESALGLVEAVREHDGPNSPNYAAFLVNAGAMLGNVGRLEEGLPHMLEGLAAFERIYGPHHYEVERHTNIVAERFRLAGRDEEYLAMRTRGLLLRLYVAGPGEPDSVLGVMPVGAELLGSMDAWAGTVLAEIDRVPRGHNKRARYLGHAAIALSSIEDQLGIEFDPERLLLDAYTALPDAERPDEVRRQLGIALPAHYERAGDEAEARRWRELLGTPIETSPNAG